MSPDLRSQQPYTNRQDTYAPMHTQLDLDTATDTDHLSQPNLALEHTTCSNSKQATLNIQNK
ncbi:hypothetical protein PENANT_c010G08312 [Penicillium antarcticum]|uniref:Uncharacterized protein n=1 Tax=Penicillium antarcticum TaxID=416450 RepID=A0A1V6Q8P1_9EURO|nr:hypothetical protein PENANT_c010G08312 [Penicillium antarcticum]